MTAKNRTLLKAEFITGAKPTSGNFGDTIDSALNIVDPTAQVIVSPVTFDSAVTLVSSLAVSGSSSFGAVTVPTKSYPSNTTDAASTSYVTTAIANAGVGSGTVSSVTFTGDGTVLSSTPSAAVTSTGTVTATLKTQNANIVLAGPTSGGAGAVTYRALVNADLPATAVTPSTYTNATITVNQQGVLTAASTGSSASGMTLLNTVNGTNASAAFNATYITSTYNTYMLVFDTVSASVNTASIGLQVSTDNGATWKSTLYTSTGSPTVPSGEIGIFGSNFATNSRAMGTITFSKPSAAADQMFLINTVMAISSSPTQYNGSCIWGGAAAINAIRIIADSGNVTGNFHLFGISGT